MTRQQRSALVALAGLPAMGPRRLAAILRRHPADEAFASLAGGRRLHPELEAKAPEVWGALRSQAAATSVDALFERCLALGISVVAATDAEYPAALAAEADPPPVMFVRGDLDVAIARRVGIVGTRNATAAGRATAFELGQQLAAAGVCVVSGLARGIDGAAHRGVRAGSGRAVGVVANGLDRPYPKQNADLWEWVGSDGLLLSEWPPGTVPEAWRFPQRNRIIAAMSEVLVVVESRERGGSLITANEAVKRGVDVMAVPGSTRSRASAGTNELLVSGATPVTRVDDVLVALGLNHARQFAQPPLDVLLAEPTGDQLDVLVLCARHPCTLDMLANELGRPIAELAVELARLEGDGAVADVGGWFEATGSKLLGSDQPGSKLDGS